MDNYIDVTFDFYSDTPKGKDPDSYSPTLRNYHKLLWSKPLPSGLKFDLNDNFSRLLYHKSELGEFILSSDAIGHTYSKTKIMAPIINKIPSFEINQFFSTCSTIGGYIIFPATQVDYKMTINASRGLNRKIKDRFDLTLECLRRFYSKEDSPLSDTFQRYSQFFDLFENFKEYVNFFLLQDLVNENYSLIKYWIPFNDFDDSPLPNNVEEYRLYKKNLMEFIKERNHRISELAPFD